MALRSVQLPPGATGRLWLSSMPGRFEPWPQFLQQAAAAGVQQVVCLAPREEIALLAPAYHAAVAGGRLPWRWTLLPMRNYGLPEDMAGFRTQVLALARDVQSGGSVLLHCAAGLGRTGSAAACVLRAMGLEAHEAVQRVRDAGSNPQNAVQAGFIDQFRAGG